MSSKTILQRLPLRLYRRLEDILSRCDHLEWKHFDAGVIKVGWRQAQGEKGSYVRLLRCDHLECKHFDAGIIRWVRGRKGRLCQRAYGRFYCRME